MPLTQAQIAQMQIDAQGATPVSGLSPDKFAEMDAIAKGGEPAETGITDDIAQEWNNRLNNVARISNADDRGMVRGGIEEAGQGLGFVNDAIGSVLSRALGAVTPDAVKDAAKKGVAYVANSAPAQALSQGYNNIAPQGSPLRDDLGAAGNLLGIAMNAAPTGAVVRGAQAVATSPITAALAKMAGNAALDAGKAAVMNPVNTGKAVLANLLDDPMRGLPRAADVFSEGRKAYKAAEAEGTGATSTAVDNLLTSASKAAQNPQLLATMGPDEVTGFLERLNNFQGQPMGLDTAQALSQKLDDLANKSFSAGDKNLASRYRTIKDAINSEIYNANPQDMTGSPEGFQYLQEGNRLYHQGYRGKEIEDNIFKGLGTEVPSTGIKNAFKGLAREIRENGQGSWTDEQVDAINKAAKYGIVTPALKFMGSKLNGTVAGVAAGGMPGAVAGYAAGSPFRGLANALQLKRARDVLSTIYDNPTFTP